MLFNRRFLVAIEIDASRYHAVAGARRPRLLGQNESEQMLAHLAADLKTLLPAACRCKLAAAGALFDQTQVLRPAYPVFAALESLLAQSSENSTSNQRSMGAENGRMTLDKLQPEPDIPLGLLQLLPMLVSGRAEDVQELGTAMEHRFLEEGQVSAHTARWLENAFEIPVKHARFMTLTDLNAMYRLQLEYFGFLPLWRLIDAALNDLDAPFETGLDDGQVFLWKDGNVHTAYQTFDHWSQFGGGRDLASSRENLAGGYARWTRTMRQFLAVLNAHEVALKFHLPQQPEQLLTQSYFIEEYPRNESSGLAGVTEHRFGELGTICITVIAGGWQHNYYPLTPDGLNDIQDVIHRLGVAGRTVARQDSILFDEKTRSLLAEPVQTI